MAATVSTHSLTEVSYDTENNTSLVRYLVKIKTTGESHNLNTINTTYYIDGVRYTYNHTLPYNSTTVIVDKTVTIKHNDDGTRSVSASYSCPTNISAGTLTGDVRINLTTIPRKAEITYAPNFSDLDNPTINYKNPLGESAYGLSACISLTGAVADVLYRDIPKTGTSYTFNLTDEERNVLRNATTGNKGKRNVKFCIRTVIKSGSSPVTHTAEIEFSVKETENSKPTVNISCTPYPSLSAPFDGLYIQGKNGVKVDFTAEGKYGADITSYKAGGLGISSTGNPSISDILKYDGLLDVTGTVTDSRDFANSTIQQIDVLPYNKPYIAPYTGLNEVVCTRCNSEGVISSSGIYLKIKAKRVYSPLISSGEQKNSCSLQYRFKKSTDPDTSYSEWIDILNSSSSTDLADVTLQNVVSEVSSSYYVQLRVKDGFGEEITPMKFIIPTDEVVLHLRKGGHGVGIGKYCKRYGYLDIGYDVQINGNELNDFVIEKKTVGIWNYRKWSSGVAECWGTWTGTLEHYTTISKTISGTTYSLFYAYYISVNFPSDLFLVAPIPTYSARVGSVLSSSGNIGSLTKDAMNCYVMATSGGSQKVSFYIHAIGRWK